MELDRAPGLVQQKALPNKEAFCRPLGYSVDFGARITAGQYRAEIDEQFVGREQLSQTQAMVRLHWSVDWVPSDHLTVTPSVAGRVTYDVRPSVDPRLRLSFWPDSTERQEVSLAVGLYHQIDGGLTDQRDAGTAFPPRALHRRRSTAPFSSVPPDCLQPFRAGLAVKQRGREPGQSHQAF
jgi:hypothetical protein